ncbi:type II toxin-antitoxin system RelE/ParE family toxin [Photobacterium phosphoreum]|uniref:type II toxin-antitoxin system RelE/ParE family toxin n=1 Tax=Photobacterium phosphoreum TaxID=659 RepID=UPI0005D34476|nr:type II toxin-antitoxin system RelE/ParE family toxin [Photobacterium phosphoreum]PQJ90341.1 hypothetical protein BTO21_00885 [Photobacterium phosphoreum]
MLFWCTSSLSHNTKAQEGIGRGLFCYLKGQHVYVLRAFVKKTNKTPKKEIALAREQMKEVKL